MGDKQILLSTTGTLDPVIIADMGAKTFPHPTVDFDLLTEYTEDEIAASTDLQTAIDLGHVTITDQGGNPIDDVTSVFANFRVQQLTYTDTTNKVIGPLSNFPSMIEMVSLFPLTGVVQEYTLDYTIRSVVGGSAPGAYVCISPTSSPPGGGTFDGGANPGSGIDSVLSSGDKVRIIYSG